jgi:three-Cys-motif partner protein
MSAYERLWIFDFFAGTGYDINGIPGSPIRILQQIKHQSNNILQKKVKINVCFNEYDKQKYELLQQACNQFISDNADLQKIEKNNLLKIQYRNGDFSELFPKTLSTIKEYPSLVYLDQNGMKFLADKYIDDLEKTTKTDFLYFLSSSYFLRFGNTNAFQSNMKIDIERARQNPYKYIHKSILEQLREKLPKNTKLSLYPFTIKKNNHIYGIIFGATHPRAVDKFLKTAWEKNNINGEANFDIDDDIGKNQIDLFDGRKLTKIESFKLNLRKDILEKDIRTNREAYDYTLKQGHISSHAGEEVSLMKKEKLIYYREKSPLINYENVYKEKRIISYEVLP